MAFEIHFKLSSFMAQNETLLEESLYNIWLGSLERWRKNNRDLGDLNLNN